MGAQYRKGRGLIVKQGWGLFWKEFEMPRCLHTRVKGNTYGDRDGGKGRAQTPATSADTRRSRSPRPSPPWAQGPVQGSVAAQCLLKGQQLVCPLGACESAGLPPRAPQHLPYWSFPIRVAEKMTHCSVKAAPLQCPSPSRAGPLLLSRHGVCEPGSRQCRDTCAHWHGVEQGTGRGRALKNADRHIIAC